MRYLAFLTHPYIWLSNSPCADVVFIAISDETPIAGGQCLDFATEVYSLTAFAGTQVRVLLFWDRDCFATCDPPNMHAHLLRYAVFT